ncbi:MAG: DUF3987 domain-containing protein [Gemmatimonadaceae bacterium]
MARVPSRTTESEGETIDIPAVTVSLFGCIQPGPLREYLRAAKKEGRGDDGLVQRLQLVAWPDVSGDWRNVDEYPEREARERAFGVYERLYAMTPESVEAQADEFDPVSGIPFLRFDDGAQERFNVWRTELELQLRGEEDPPALISHFAKYRSLIPSLALVIHLAEGQRGRVSLLALEMAIAWGKYLATHARRLYSPVTSSDVAPARALLTRIQNGALKDGFTVRDVYRPCWANLDKEEALLAVELLGDLGWLRAKPLETGGRPTREYSIHPQLRQSS